MSQFEKIGLDVGFVGRWSRLVWGVLILVPVAIEVANDFGSVIPLAFYGRAILYLAGITLAYAAVYYLLGERLFAKANPWINTLILVAPAFFIVWWNILFASLLGFSLPLALGFAMAFYVGVSFILQWKIKYGGCEVVAIPIILFKRRYTTYCVPLVALDAVEKKIVDNMAKTGDSASNG